MRKEKYTLSARGYSLIIKGFLKNCLVDDVLQYLVEMSEAEHPVPGFAVGQFLRVCVDTVRVGEMYQKLKDLALPVMEPDAIAVVLEDCWRRHDAKMARAVQQESRDANVELNHRCYDSLLKVYAESCDPEAFSVLQEAQQLNVPLSDMFCTSLLARCAEKKFVTFAEEVARHVRATSKMNIAMYSALMKVYAYAYMYDKACDLYHDILADGIEPDSTMIGCLMRFSVECGRTDLFKELSEKPLMALDMQSCMSLIRAAGRDRDVDRAFAVLQQLSDNNMKPDHIALNCVVDVCVKAGDIKRAEGLVFEMEDLGFADIITYNTLLKGYCQKHNLPAADALLAKMSEKGKHPNDISYNCMLNHLVATGNYKDSWKIVEQMEKNNVVPDQYTVSILLKGIKKMRGEHDVQKCFDFLDRSGVDPCSDEILLNTVLEICIRHKEFNRLAKLMANFEKSTLRPSVPTYGAIIKAYANLSKLDKCWHYWNEMKVERGLEPTDIVWGCMLDALVTNGAVEDAVDLFQHYSGSPNPVICSILVKGLANAEQPKRALQLWKDMKRNGMKMNLVAYNVMVDSQARLGNMEEVMELVEAMAADGCQPDSITHGTICKGYALKGDLSKALQVLKFIQDSKISHDAIVYNTILDGCAKHRRPELVDQILATMDANGVSPSNFTLGILLKIYARQRDLAKAIEVFRTMPQKGQFVPNNTVWSCLLSACVSNNNADEAMKVFAKMQAASVMAESRACTALVQCLVRNDRLHEAIDVVDVVYGLRKGSNKPSNASIDQECLESLLTTLAQKGFLEELGAPLLQRLRAAKVSVAGRLMASALRMEGSQKSTCESTLLTSLGRGKNDIKKNDSGHPWEAKKKTLAK